MDADFESNPENLIPNFMVNETQDALTGSALIIASGIVLYFVLTSIYLH